MEAFACGGCDAQVLAGHGQVEVRCDFCEKSTAVPACIAEDYDAGSKAPQDAWAESDRAIDTLVEQAYESPEVPRAWLFGFALICGLLPVVGGLAQSSDPADIVLRAVGAFVVGLLAAGWTLQWLSTTGLAQKADALRMQLPRPRCPSCEKAISTPKHGAAFRCVGCGTALLVANDLAVEAEPAIERPLRWSTAAAKAVDPGAQPTWSRGQLAFVALSAAILIACLAWWAWH